MACSRNGRRTPRSRRSHDHARRRRRVVQEEAEDHDVGIGREAGLLEDRQLVRKGDAGDRRVDRLEPLTR
jgi:hypothetical protein